MPTSQQNKQLIAAELGFRVVGVTKTVPQNAAQTVFTVTGGRIIIAHLSGVVTTVIGGTTPAAKYIATPTVGAANDMCTAGTITAAAVNCMFVLPVATGSALTVQTSAVGSLSGQAYGGQIVNAFGTASPTTIGFNVSAADATGSVQHTLVYIPLDPAATVVAN